jgi:hypothetical protein
MRITGNGASAKLALPLVLVAAAVAGGCGAGTHPSAATAQAAAHPTVTLPGQAGVAEPQPVIATGPVVRLFAGARSQAIGSLSEHRLVVIRWKVAKPPIQIYTSQGNLLLSSDRRSGAIRLRRGEYRNVRIATNGHWTIELRSAA